MEPQYFVFIIIITGMIYSVRSHKLTLLAALVGGILGAMIFWGTGFVGFSQMVAFFLLGSMATEWKRSIKSVLIPHERTERTVEQVLANSGVAGLLALLTVIFPTHHSLLLVMVSATFSSAAADTISSELGTVYGKRFVNILTLKADRRGADGVISLEGTLYGLVGSMLIALIYALFEGWNMNLLWIVLAGTAGNFADSILGAWLERKALIGNNAVNFLNTLIAALVALLLSL